MLLTYFLSGEGDGTYVLEAIAADCTGYQVTLGTKTITVDNANAVKPFGAINTPAQGGAASGSNYRNHGWVLTPQPNKIPEDGSFINVYINGVYLGTQFTIYSGPIFSIGSPVMPIEWGRVRTLILIPLPNQTEYIPFTGQRRIVPEM